MRGWAEVSLGMLGFRPGSYYETFIKAVLTDTRGVSTVVILIHQSREHRLTQREGDTLSALGDTGLMVRRERRK